MINWKAFRRKRFWPS